MEVPVDWMEGPVDWMEGPVDWMEGPADQPKCQKRKWFHIKALVLSSTFEVSSLQALQGGSSLHRCQNIAQASFNVKHSLICC